MAANLFAQALRRFVISQQPGMPDLEELRGQRVRSLLRHVAKHVPLYRELYHGIPIESITAPNDLWKLPALSKADYIRVGPKGYTDERLNLGDLYSQTTSGSVGAALTMYATNEEARYHLAGLWSGWVGAGVNVHDRLFMMGAPYLAERIEPFNSTFIPVQMPMNEIVDQFLWFRPTVVIGLVESIALLAVELKRRDIPQRHQVRAVFPFGQTYSLQLQRMVESGFKAEVSVLYGSAETGWLGYECAQRNGFHVPVGRVVVHIARTGKPDEPAANGETGEVIITSLARASTPFIRYRLYDSAAMDITPCPCGRISPRLTNLEGRIQDFLVATNGRWVGPSTVAIDLVVSLPSILDYRIQQDSPDEIKVSLVTVADLTDDNRKQIEDILQRHLGPVRASIDIVDEIPREKSGKRRRVFRTFDLPGQKQTSG